MGMQYSNQKNHPRTVGGRNIYVPSKTGAIFGAVLGVWFGGNFLLGTFGLLLALLLSIGDFVFALVLLVTAVITGAIGTGAMVLGVRSIKKLLRIDRMKKYVQTIGGKEYCNISQLAARIGKPDGMVVKDLEYMIQNRWFGQGHLDKEKKCLMLTDQMYQQYMQLERQKQAEMLENRKKPEPEKPVAERVQPEKKMSETEKVIAQGKEYIAKIRACNDAIPGDEVSAKIFRIETLANKIFERVEQDPQSIPDIRKMMEYYLPTTVKLLEAYAQMDAQPVGGENIRTTKKEIEDTLDTINVAFEKLLDDLFQETAWDVSSDISVLNAMLAQEGLTEDGLKKKQEG